MSFCCNQGKLQENFIIALNQPKYKKDEFRLDMKMEIQDLSSNSILLTNTLKGLIPILP